MLMTGITIAIAAIPEGLPATVTIALALAVGRMLKRNALVHKLHSVETLGCASVICSDKTGTITENRMTVTKIMTAALGLDVTGSGHRIAGEIRLGKEPAMIERIFGLEELLNCCVLCNNANISRYNTNGIRSLQTSLKRGEWVTSGDPTEIAMLVAAAKADVTRECLEKSFNRTDEIPFDSETRCMKVIVSKSEGLFCYAKGAPDVILSQCSHALINGKEIMLSSAIRYEILKKGERLAADALRVLAFSYKKMRNEKDTSELVFLGLMGMLDPPRAEAKRAIRICEKANIKTVMITGDHKATACAIASQSGIMKTDSKALTGDELSRLSDDELSEMIEQVAVFARVNPSDKLRIVRAYRKRGHIVAMTGDGVNDAPAIKEADIGVSMGITGTDVTKQAADVILLDDNFATLVSAVEQGRTIYSNIRKFVRYLLSCNIGEVMTMFAGILMGLPMVLLPTQILLVNLLTDGLPAVALGLEPTEELIMKKAPRKSTDGFFSGGLMTKIIFRGILIGLCTLGSFVAMLRLGHSTEVARTAALFTLVLSQLIHVFECKSEEKTLFTVNFLSNPFLLLAVLLSGIVIAAAIYLPVLQIVFSTVPLTLKQLGISAAFSLAVPVLASFFNKD
jgi:Ca2+-transporting ATPase